MPNVVDFIFPEIYQWHLAKRIIEKKMIGKIINVNVDWTFLSYDLRNQIKSWKTDVEQGGGALSFYFSHTFHYLEYFIGRIKNLKCVISSSEKSPNKGETIINMIILFENGCMGNAHMNIGYVGQQKHLIEFQGEKGVVTLQNNSNSIVDNFELIVKTLNKTKTIRTNKTFNLSSSESEDPRVKVVKPLAQRFINWCNTGIPTKPDFQDGLRAQELIDIARVSDSNFYKYK